MAVNLSISIMHTPGERSSNVHAMQRALARAVVVEEAGLGVWDTARRAWLAHELSASHHLVLQDDATLCPAFEQRALAEVSARPFVPLALCSVGPTVALVLPVPMIAPWLEWCAARPNLPAHDDVRLTKWLRTQGVAFVFAQPALVEHGAFPSLLGHVGRP